MKRSLLVSGLFAFLVAVGCGDSSGDGGDGDDGSGVGDVGSCEASATSCTELRTTAAAADAFADACNKKNLKGGDGCEISPKVGCCTASNTSGAAANCYYGDDYAMNVASLEMACAAQGFTWEPG